jgi:probable FeS assembly SUF system protein SufT
MQNVKTVDLTRNVEAVRIPIGETAILNKGETVDITQTLGGTFTVRTMEGLFKIEGKDADALGLEAPPETQELSSAKGPLDERQVWDALKTCFDPEIPVNIVDLGLVYDMVIENLPKGGAKVMVKMTLTAPGCGMGPSIAGDAQSKLLQLPGVAEAFVDIVWDPPWHQSMITAEGRKILGL